MTEPAIALVFTPETWVEDLHRHFTDHGGACVRQVVIDPGLVLEEQYDTLVVSHRWPGLTRAVVDELHDHGRTVLGVFNREEPTGRTMLREFGVDRVIESDAGPRLFLDVLESLVREVIPGERRREEKEQELETHRARIVTVRGPAGTGATEVSMCLARVLASSGHAVLVDADDVAPAVSPRLGLPVEPNLVTMIEAHEHGKRESPVLESTIESLRMGVVGGLPNPRSWKQVRPGEVMRFLQTAARSGGYVITDVSACLDETAESGLLRHGLARALVGGCDSLVAVGNADPVGVTRLLHWIADAVVLAVDVPLHIVINRAPSDPYRRGEILSEITRSFVPASFTFVPFDRKVEKAAWRGDPVPSGSFTRSVEELARRVLEECDRLRFSSHSMDRHVKETAGLV